MDTLSINLGKDEKKEFYKALITLAIPMILQSAIGTALNFIDTFMISSLSTDVIAGVTAGNRVSFIIMVICFGVFSGASVLMAQYHGNNDRLNVKRVLGISLLVACSIGIIVSVICFLFPAWVLSLITDDMNVIKSGTSYLKYVSISYVPMAISSCYAAALRSTKKVKKPVIINTIAVLANTLLNYLLIFGNGGAPKLGATGAGIATLIARVLEMILFLLLIYGFDKELGGKVSELFDFNKEFLDKFLHVVMPVVANETAWVIGMSVYAVIFGHLEGDALAAVGIIDPVTSIIMFSVWGLNGAAAVIIGNKIGAGDDEKILDFSRLLIRIMFIISVILSLIMYIFNDNLIGLFPIEDSLRYTVLQLMIVVILGLPLRDNNFLLIVGLMRSGGDTKFCFYVEMLSLWLVGIPLTLIAAFVLKLDLLYVYAIMLFSDEAVKFFLAMPRIYSKKWIKNLAVDKNEVVEEV